MSISLFLRPKAIISQACRPVLDSLAWRGLMRMFCVDKAHFIEQSGRCFRPELQAALKALADPLKILALPCPRILLLATIIPNLPDSAALAASLTHAERALALLRSCTILRDPHRVH